jgi:hypothetical protein
MRDCTQLPTGSHQGPAALQRGGSGGIRAGMSDASSLRGGHRAHGAGRPRHAGAPARACAVVPAPYSTSTLALPLSTWSAWLGNGDGGAPHYSLGLSTGLLDQYCPSRSYF